MKLKSITLFTANLVDTFHFYKDTLECPVQIINAMAFKVTIGETQLLFQKSHEMNQPFYHFAIDIPYNHFNEMKRHYLNILFLLTEKGQHTATFDTFYAHSFYFNDPSGNVVELIARNSNISDYAQFIRISEIGFVCNDLLNVYAALSDYHLQTVNHAYPTAENFNFIGDSQDESYIILTSEEKKWDFSDQSSKAYPIKIETTRFTLSYINEQWFIDNK
ncbi:MULTISPECIES: hypothetical protein [Staphylococcus]|uniref:Toxoflavin-degrading enzyme domain-containing protein n=1 Tax=Staphylococcus hsinchuensis TaxID=3051183 RepID=A0ABZ3EES0_9STAP|nr:MULTISPECIES: hypothetical protein [unclassified Staphylococcus]